MDLFADDFSGNYAKNQEIQISSDFGPWLESPTRRKVVNHTSNGDRKMSMEQKFLSTVTTKKPKHIYSDVKLEVLTPKKQSSPNSKQVTQVLCIAKKFRQKYKSQYHKEISPPQSSRKMGIRETYETEHWQLLSPTTYLYDESTKKSLLKQHDSIDHSFQLRSTQGTKNLQRILKMKERLRQKNNSYVRKIKERTNPTTNFECTFEEKKENGFERNERRWRSTTLTVNPQCEDLPSSKQKCTYRSKRLVFLKNKNTHS